MKLSASNPDRLRLGFSAALLAVTCLVSFGQDATLSYLSLSRADSTKILSPPPLPDSPEQAADLEEVIAVHKACTTKEAAIAFSEKKFSVFNFAPAVGTFFQPGKFPKTEAFFQRVQKDAAQVTDTAKEYWKRPRPYVIDPTLASGKLEKSFSYPSGHSTESMVLALVLADIFPEKTRPILAIARDIGWHRVQIARHYPTDIYAGRVFALALVREMKTQPDFQKDLVEVKRELLSATRAETGKAAAPRPVAANEPAPLISR